MAWAFGPISASFIIAGVIASVLTGNKAWFFGLAGLALVGLVLAFVGAYKDAQDAAVDDTVDPRYVADDPSDEFLRELLGQDDEPKYIAGTRRDRRHLDGEGNYFGQ